MAQAPEVQDRPVWKRRVFLISMTGVLLCALATGVWHWVYSLGEASISSREESIHQIRIGMTYEQVKRILGQPQDDWGYRIFCHQPGRFEHVWIVEGGRIRVYFTESKVSAKYFLPAGGGWSDWIDVD
jgi:hypothetical protein